MFCNVFLYNSVRKCMQMTVTFVDSFKIVLVKLSVNEIQKWFLRDLSRGMDKCALTSKK